MIVTETPLEYARLRKKSWQARLQAAERGRFSGWHREVALCKGAIAALDEILLPDYARGDLPDVCLEEGAQQ